MQEKQPVDKAKGDEWEGEPRWQGEQWKWGDYSGCCNYDDGVIFDGDHDDYYSPISNTGRE